MSNKISIPEEVLEQKIYKIRGKNVMIDKDLADLYEVDTKRLKEQVRRNIDRFPEDFMIELTDEEYSELKDTLEKKGRGKHSKYPPFAFTEHGVLMLSSVLNSDRAIKVNVQIIRVFNRMRTLLLTHEEIFRKLEELESKGAERDDKIMLIFEYIKQFEEVKQQELEQKNRKPIGYQPKKKD